jgi:protein SCO1/2
MLVKQTICQTKPATLNKRIVKLIPVVLLILLLSACGKAPPAGAVKHYPLTGKIVSLNPKEQTASVDAAAIPNFMGAMTMDYPVKSKSEFDSLRVGANIEATINVAEAGDYDLSGIKVQNSGK